MAGNPADRRGPLDLTHVRLVRSAGLASVLVALTLVALKLFAWFATDSVAVLSSLADSVLDLLASTMTFVAVRFAFEPADREHRFGHGKLEAVAGLVQACVILGSAGYVGTQAVRRLVDPAPISEPAVGTAVIVVSLILTVALVLFQRHVALRTGSIAIGADRLHYVGDVLTNIGVLVALALSSFFGWHWADPLLGLVVVVVILASVRAIVLRAFDVLLDRELPSTRRDEILAIVQAHEAVLGVHDLRTRTSGTQEFIQFHLELAPALELQRAHEISHEVEAEVRRRFPRAEVIIHAEPAGIDDERDRF
jgi:ferrous-iron efflux pump FieF